MRYLFSMEEEIRAIYNNIIRIIFINQYKDHTWNLLNINSVFSTRDLFWCEKIETISVLYALLLQNKITFNINSLSMEKAPSTFDVVIAREIKKRVGYYGENGYNNHTREVRC